MSKFDKLHVSHDANMKAIIIYDNFVFAAKANELLQQAALHVDAAMHWNIKRWRVDALSLARNAEEALNDATDAHLIVFAGHRAHLLPSWLLNWLERWVASRHIKDAAFAVIGGGNGNALVAPATELSRFAKRHGLNFITDNDTTVKEEEDLSTHSNAEEEMSPSLIQARFVDMPVGNPYRGWGIND